MAATVVPTVLNFKNYVDWSFRMKTYFLAEDLWDIIAKEPSDGEDRKVWEKKDAKALYAIHNSCGYDTYPLIKKATSAKEAWTSLSDEFKQDEPSDESDRLVNEAYPTPTDANATPESTLEGGLAVTGGHDEEIFGKYVESDDWDNAIETLRQHPQLASARVALDGGTVLHHAIRKSWPRNIIKQLVEFMKEQDLEIPDNIHFTAFRYLIRDYPERVSEAKCMLNKNPNLRTILPPNKDVPLVGVAQGQIYGERMARYLYSLTDIGTLKASHAAHLISKGFRLERFDIAWDLIQRYPKLAITKNHKGNIPLVELASNRSAFKSGSKLKLWERLIYHGIRIKPLPKTVNVDQWRLAEQKEKKRHPLISPGIHRIYKMKLMHERVKQFLPLMCKEVRGVTNDGHLHKKLNEALCVAAKQGHVEYITHLHKDASFPIFEVQNKEGQNLLQISIESRHRKVYDLVLRESNIRRNIYKAKDKFDNSILHTVARITPLSQIEHIPGAALQMQGELQWFQDVKSELHPKYREFVNKDNMTPQKVFTENHKELRKEAENSMKETATSCTVVGALIITMMFAALFTVPGGNDEKMGLPTFLTKKAFTTFIVSDAISLFSSTTSVIMFLGILTSRFSEDDFYKSLPTKMIIGLFTLFLSISTMMIAFSCALYITLDGELLIVIPSILLASIPVTSFIWLQFPLLVGFFISTFGCGK